MSTALPEPSKEALRRISEAIGRLGTTDPDSFANSLADHLYSLAPTSAESGLSDEQRAYLLESGDFSTEELAETEREVARGQLQLSATEVFSMQLHASMSLEGIAGSLRRDEAEILAAVRDGVLYAFKAGGRLRFPVWQLNDGGPGLLPGLPEIIRAVVPRWPAPYVAAFMCTPQHGLVAVGRQTPAEWLRTGMPVEAVVELIESRDWS